MSHYEINSNAGTYGVRFYIDGESRFSIGSLDLPALRAVIRNARADGFVSAQAAADYAVAILETRGRC